MYDSRPWGWWLLLFWSPWLWLKLIRVRPGQRTSLQFHLHRAELHLGWWYLRYVPALESHRMTAGWYLELAWGCTDEADIVRLEDDYHRTEIDRHA